VLRLQRIVIPSRLPYPITHLPAAAALRDFKPAYDRFGSFATEAAEPAQPLISGSISKAEVKSQHR
jgi:hypothetical protein